MLAAVQAASSPVSSGCSGTYDAERRYIHAHGLKAFWDLDWDPYDTKRPPVA